MSERRRSTRTRAVTGFIDFGDGEGEVLTVALPLPLSPGHAARGGRFQRERVFRRRTLLEIAVAVGLTVGDLSAIEEGIAEALEEEWAALWAALGEAG